MLIAVPDRDRRELRRSPDPRAEVGDRERVQSQLVEEVAVGGTGPMPAVSASVSASSRSGPVSSRRRHPRRGCADVDGHAATDATVTTRPPSRSSAPPDRAALGARVEPAVRADVDRDVGKVEPPTGGRKARLVHRFLCGEHDALPVHAGTIRSKRVGLVLLLGAKHELACRAWQGCMHLGVDTNPAQPIRPCHHRRSIARAMSHASDHSGRPLRSSVGIGQNRTGRGADLL